MIKSPRSREVIRRNFIVASLLLMSAVPANAQFWIEQFGFDFNFCDSQASLADGTFTGNGQWTVTASGVNGPVANLWYISSAEGGGYDPFFNNCGERCINNGFLFDRSLHIGEFSPTEDIGATYNNFAGLNFFQTDFRAESPNISTAGEYGISVQFNYAAGQTPSDFASVDYFQNGTWIELAVLPATGECFTGSINWQSFSVNLPASANNSATPIKIGFRWRNGFDGDEQALSVAIDDVQLFAGPDPNPPVANFNTVNGIVQVCENNCITFNSTTTYDATYSTGEANATFAWTFQGGTPATSSQPSPTVCYDNPGIFDVNLVVTDNIGASQPEFKNNFIQILDCGPVINITTNNNAPCANEECIDFTDLSTGNGIFSWAWTFTSTVNGTQFSSNLQNPTNICLSVPGFWNVTLQATDADGTESQTYPGFINVLDCSGPEVNFSMSRAVICPGECIQLTDLSITNNPPITAWNWTLPGGQANGAALPGVSTMQNPTVCYEIPGIYTITLSATDAEGPSAITKTMTITVDACTGPPNVGIGSTVTEICTGDCVDFFDQSLGLTENFLWVFQGVADPNSAVSTEENPSVICYSTAGTYNVTLTVSNSNGQIDFQTFTDYITVNDCINPPVPRIEVSQDTICAGDCVNFADVSTGFGINSWIWNFQGAVAGSTTSTAQNPQNVCYNQTGSYAVSLEIIGSGGDSIRVFNQVVTVVSTPACRPQIAFTAPDTLCAGDCGQFMGNFTNADSVRWTFPGGTPSTSTARNPGLVCFDEVGEYTILVEAWNEAGAAPPQVFDVVVTTRPDLSAGPDRTINSGATIQLTASLATGSPTGEFTWQPFEMVDDFTAQTVSTSPDESIIFIVYFKQDMGCTAVDTVKVNVNFVAAIGVPTAFSPNGDGRNDVLFVLGQGIARMEFKIFNRYGLLVFESRNQALGWDGTDGGRDLNPGTFVYTLEVTFADGPREVFTGDVTLIK